MHRPFSNEKNKKEHLINLSLEKNRAQIEFEKTRKGQITTICMNFIF